MKRVLSYEPIREQEVCLLIESISQSPSCRIVVDLTEKSTTLPTDIIFRIAFEKQFEGDEFYELVNEAVALLGSYSASEFLPIPFVDKAIDWLNGREARLQIV